MPGWGSVLLFPGRQTARGVNQLEELGALAVAVAWSAASAVFNQAKGE